MKPKILYFKDTSFANLMQRRVYNVLLLASKYALFTIEEDGRIDEQIFNEYTGLHLRYPPRFTLVSSVKEADQMLRERQFELIISMPSGESINPFSWAKTVKEEYPDIPIVVLTPYNRAVVDRIGHEDLSAIDYVFSWLGNSELLLAIIKLIEDQMNVDVDIQQVGLQSILLVEDDIRTYSAILPMLYKHVFVQSRAFMTEALNSHERMLRMRGRPKILLARNLEEATELYSKYHHNTLGVITDVEFPQGGDLCAAGETLCRTIRQHDPFLPIIIDSTDEQFRPLAAEFDACFLNKDSNTLLMELRDAITELFGFGDFKFRNPKTNKVELTVHNLRDLQYSIFQVSDETLYRHVSRNDISRWLYSRALFPLAEFLSEFRLKPDDSMDDVKHIIFDAIVDYRRIKNRGIVANFHRDMFDKYSNFARIGGGTMGSKGRGLAFIDAMLKRHDFNEGETVPFVLSIPRTVVICTDIFSQFMEENHLHELALSDAPDEVILEAFLKAELPLSVVGDLQVLLRSVNGPLAVRSSSLLEDTQYQPFAGIYSTYMIPNQPDDQDLTLSHLESAIKAVYASVYYRDSKAYMTSTKNVIDEERMAVVIQEVVGVRRNDRYYPSFSGVARSLNFYPIGAEKTEEGVVNVALGLGKHIVDGGVTLRFSPRYPDHVLQTSTLELTLRETQTTFNALDLTQKEFRPQVDDGFNLLKLPVSAADQDGMLRLMASTYNFREQALYDNVLEDGRRVITFANILKHGSFPLARIMEKLLRVAQQEMGCPVEIEFAVNLQYALPRQESTQFSILQIRPIVESKVALDEDLTEISDDQLILRSNNALGQGIYDDLFDLIYVKPDTFDPAHSEQMRAEIEELNSRMREEGINYILIGPGRWGSSDPWLGIPVKWPQISEARVIVEAGLEDFRVEPSQGTHFFQNLTSMGVAYFTLNAAIGDGYYDLAALDAMPAVCETAHFRHVRFGSPAIVKVDGRSKQGVIHRAGRE